MLSYIYNKAHRCALNNKFIFFRNMRKYRELEDQTKQKISRSMVNRPKSDLHKANISKGLKAYWERIPNRPQPENNGQNGGADNGTEKTN